jgi:hypothetical protein
MKRLPTALACALMVLLVMVLPGLAAAAVPCQLERLHIKGLWRTKTYVVQREVVVKPGQTLTAAALKLAEVRLWNSGLFSQVHLAVEQTPTAADSVSAVPDGASRCTLAIQVEERWTINPLFSFQVIDKASSDGGGGRDQTAWLNLGMDDSNLFGRFLEVAGSWERYAVTRGDREDAWHGFLFLIRDPRFAGRRMEATAQVDWQVRPRPDFSDRRLRLRLDAGHLLWSDRLRVGARVDLQQDNFLQPADRDVPVLPLDSKAAIADVGARVGRVDVVRIRQVGHSIELRPGFGLTSRQEKYAQIWLQGLGFWAPGSRWNLALRLQGAAMTAAPVHLRQYIGGLYEVRGYRDYLRASHAYGLVNAEVRFVAWDWTWLAVVPTVFADMAALAQGQDVRGLASLGGGVRLLIPRFVRSGLRLDVAWPLTQQADGSSGPGASIGVFQFF